ncbi:PspC domain-containing protein [Hallerella succinigenes]|nr:PspC domain-containing protein [Hallerella succinigenes]
MKRNASKRLVAGVCSGIAGKKTLFLWVLRVVL